MKCLLLIFTLFSTINLLAQAKKITTIVDMNRLSLESKIVGKTSFPMLFPFKETQLILNGAGLRELLWIDIYACGLYLKHPETSSTTIINNDETMIVRMDILSKAVSHEKMVKAFHKGFIDSNSKTVVKKLQPEINEFLKHIKGLELNVGDKIDVAYEKEQGLSLYINYKKIGSVGGLEFKKAIFNIWISNNPVDKSLKPELLNGAKKYMLK